MGLFAARAGGLTALLLLVGCGVAPLPGPRFPPQSCRLVPVADSATGAPLTGIEDLALAGSDLVLSAYDRLAVEAALDRGEAAPEGGLWRVEMSAVAQGPVRAEPIVRPGTVTGGLRPHGIAMDGDRLAVVNRRIGADGRPDPVVLSFDLSGPEPRLVGSWRGPGFCALNDVAFEADALLATLDRAGCPGLSLAEAVAGRGTGRLLRIDEEGQRTVASGFRFANGVAVLPDGRVAVAETRGRSIRLSDGTALALPGGPDNLTLAPADRIVVALHPSLLRLALYRFGWRDRAPSRVVAVDPASGAVETLFDDPAGRLFPGATVGLLADGMLVAGSIRAAGLLLCR